MTEEEIATKNIEGRACVACKWCAPLGVFRCGRPEPLEFNLVTGWQAAEGQKPAKCYEERESGECGPEGKFFEARGKE